MKENIENSPVLPRITRLFFQFFFVFVHLDIGAFEDGGYVFVVFVNGHTAGDNGVFRAPVFTIALVDLFDQIVDVFVVSVLRDHGEFVPAHAENGAVLKGVADDLDGLLDK